MAVCEACRGTLEEEARFCPYCGIRRARPPARERLGSGAQIDLGWGRAILRSPLGEGGMGIVFAAWLYYDPEGPRAGTSAHPVAVKVLHPTLRARERAQRLFLREATALGRLSHPNIVHFFGLGQRGDQLAIVMELCEGQPLSQVIERHLESRPCLPFARAWHYFSQLLGALAAIHALGIIHRDVKPSNVLVRHDGVVKLTDFGIARVPAEQARDTGNMAPGTGAYMAPEQVLGRDLDARADLYAAAVVLYEMLAGTTPFDAPDRNEIMVRTAQVEQAPPPLSSHVASTPAVLDRLLSRALAKDPELRFPSAVALGEALREGMGLPATEGWAAQRRFAASARALSSPGLCTASSAEIVPSPAAERLRTAVLEAYRS